MVYDKNHDGIQLDSQVADNLSDNDLQGLLTTKDLQSLLSPSECVGVRVYNVEAVAAGPARVLGVGVRENGSELQDLYLLSNGFVPGTAPTDAEVISRDTAVDLVLGNVNDNLHFAAFFSRKMLGDLLADKNGRVVDGVGFFVKELGRGLNTHIGAAYLDSRRADGSTLQSHIQSDRACPEHCAKLVDTTAMDLASAATELSPTTGGDSGIYLVRW